MSTMIDIIYDNAYKKGYVKAMNDLLDNYNKHNMSFPALVDMLLLQAGYSN